ncbi:MAG: hypothetical protein ACRD12_17335 [Acidimicrobiales bacterium]
MAFRHPLVREAIYEDLAPALRRALHLQAARSFVAAGSPLLKVATHLLLGASRGDGQAVGWLRDAALGAVRLADQAVSKSSPSALSTRGPTGDTRQPRLRRPR